jgi:hypothetical protein
LYVCVDHINFEIMKLKINLLDKHYFLLVALIGLIPIFSGHLFPTLDGAAHLHNSNLINSLLFNEKSIINDFVQFNPEPVPNWIGHFILSVFNLFLPGFLAEKILLIIYIIGIPYSFRYLIKVTSPSNELLSFLIFPFIFSGFFFFGFYNFILSLILLFFTLSFWIKNKHNSLAFGTIFNLFLLITLTYFSHVFVFAILILIISLYILIDFTNRFFTKKEGVKVIRLSFFKQTIGFFISSIIPLTLFLIYFFSRDTSSFYTYLSVSELTDNLINMAIMTGLVPEEKPFVKFLSYIFLILFLIALYNRIKGIKHNFKSKTPVFSVLNVNDTWLIIAITLLFFYYTSSDYNDFGGLISQRIALLFYIFILIWIVCQQIHRWVQLSAVAIFILLHIIQVAFYTTKTSDLRKYGTECYELSSLIESNSIVLPLNYTDNWLHFHLSNYIGAEKPVIVLENYECGKDYFPLKWNMKTIPSPTIQGKDIESIPCVNWEYSGGKSAKIDYILVLGNFPEDKDECTSELIQLINDGYKIIYNKEKLKLFQLK